MDKLLATASDLWREGVAFMTAEVYWNLTITQWFGVAAVSLLVCYMIYMHSDRYQERVVSKRKIQAEHRRVKEVIGDRVSVAIESLVGEKAITRDQAEFWYGPKKLGKIGLDDLGYDPTYGKIHDRMWRKPALPNWVVKSAILSRLGTGAKARLDKMLRRKPPSKKAELLASIAKRS